MNGNGGFIALRTAMPPEQMENALRATVRSIDAQLPLSQVQTMEHAISESEAPRRFNTALISSFAAIAVLLAVLGIYSVIAFSVALRVQEMAIRMALGSQRVGHRAAGGGCPERSLRWWDARSGWWERGLRRICCRAFLFGVHALDPLVLTLAAIVLLALTAVASLLPARRAASVELTEALRTE